MVDNLNCDFCQRFKVDGKGYGFLPEREVQSIPFEECTSDLIGPWKIQEKKSNFIAEVSHQRCVHYSKKKHVASAKNEYYLISINHAVCEDIVYIHIVIATLKNTTMKLYPLLCMPWEQQCILPWEVAPEVSHSTGTYSKIFLWLLIGRQAHLINENHTKGNQNFHQYDYIPPQRVIKKKIETSQGRQKNQWTMQSSKDTCKWHFDNRIKTRHLRETQHKKG